MARSGMRGKRREDMFSAAKDDLAEQLENNRLWLRAASRWGEVIEACNDSDLFEFYVQRREYCISKSNERHRARMAEWHLNADLSLVRQRIDTIYRESNLGPVSYWYIEWD
ncbi:PerC family transcriptional regulator [Klebsiella oxytoca]|uniref:PerC family transcriptional regulator n=1 Tax=Klebsiella oxytoca TaxID=571 RepID=A0AAP2BIF9_KLEOX|nr:PerC family transcriptional regulator [Klebsiella oxytoca]MBQ0600924.1 PerC family transcriptional regulator [Klebsiella oxytoca]